MEGDDGEGDQAWGCDATVTRPRLSMSPVVKGRDRDPSRRLACKPDSSDCGRISRTRSLQRGSQGCRAEARDPTQGRGPPDLDASGRRRDASVLCDGALAEAPGCTPRPRAAQHRGARPPLGLSRKRRPDSLERGILGGVWKIVAGRHVHVSDHGQVRLIRTGKLFTVVTSKRRPIPSMRYTIDGRRFWPTVPQLMLEAFRPDEVPRGIAGLRDRDPAILTLEDVDGTGRRRRNTPKSARAKSEAPDRAKVLAALKASVPRYYEPHVRQDIIHLVAACLAGELQIDGLAKAIRKAATRHRAARHVQDGLVRRRGV